jgi:nucleoside-triphosphatase
MSKTILLMGRPGVGKTTIIRQIAQHLGDAAKGFYTSEIREHGQRKGFKIVTLDGQEGILAHTDIAAGPRVSKYGVDLRALDEVGVAALERAIEGAQYVVVDEIGKMELFSERFREAVKEAVQSDKAVIGTVMSGRNPWVDELKSLPQVTVLKVTPANRDGVVQRVLDLLHPPLTPAG